MNTHTVRGFLVVIAMYCATLVANAQQEPTPEDTESQERIIEYDHSPDKVIVEMRISGWTPADPPILQIFGDGLLVVTRIDDSADKGVYETRLSETEMNELLAFLADCGLMEFDERAVRKEIETITNRRKQEAEAAGQPHLSKAILDGATISIKVALTKYQSSESEKLSENRQFTVKWYEARFDSKNFPGIHALALLAEAERYLIELVEKTTTAGKQNTSR